MVSQLSYLLALTMGIIAAVTWWRRGQSVRKGFGYSFHLWSLGDFVVGLLITFVGMLGIFLVELLIGAISIGPRVEPAAMDNVLLLLIIGAIFEEVLFRSLLLSGLVIVLGGRKWLAILISAALFGIIHISNPGASPISAFGNALGGIIYGIAFLGGKNIWLSLGLHFSWNFSQGPILGFPVSGVDMGGLLDQENIGADLITGGAYGPEAGLVGIVFRFVIMALVLWYLQWRSAGKGDIASLSFPIPEYENPPKRVQPGVAATGS